LDGCRGQSSKAVAQQPPAGVTITFLANEGVLLSAGGKGVLIDALFEKYGPGYAVPADSTRAALANARAPFDRVDLDLVLVTIAMVDHFHSRTVVAHLVANPRATLLTSAQVIDSLRGRVPAGSSVTPRLMAGTMAPGSRRREVVNGVSVELLGLPHAGLRHQQVEHLVYLVEIGGRRVLHVGDADVTEAAFAPFRLDTARIDVALIPHWVVTDRTSRGVIEKWIKPRQVVAFHVSEGDEMIRWPREVRPLCRRRSPSPDRSKRAGGERPLFLCGH